MHNKKTNGIKRFLLRVTGAAAAAVLGVNLSVSVMAEDKFGELLDMGFPPSYADKLCVLAKQHPAWSFIPLHISRMNGSYSFDYVIKRETDDPATNLVSSADIYSQYWDSALGAVFDGGWYSACDSAVEYFVDPRNFLNSQNIFMFENIGEAQSVEKGEELCKKILSGTFMSGKILQNGKSVERYLAEVGAELGISAAHLASRIRLEQGVNGTPLSSGSCGSLLSELYKNKVQSNELGYVATPYSGFSEAELKQYNGYYNYFNIGATGNGLFNIYLNGMKTAKAGTPSKHTEWGGASWNEDWKALYGGAAILKEKYINDYQNTLYLQKFNVDPRSRRNFWGQYMQNVMGAYTESIAVSKAYSASDSTEGAFSFLIPVYSGMPGDDIKVMADVNRDGVCNSADVSDFCGYIVSNGSLAHKNGSSLDINGDGVINNRDAAEIAKRAE